jgi:protein TonB
VGEPSNSAGWRRWAHALGVGVGAFGLTLLCFLVLPLLQAITKSEKADLELRDASVAELPPPPDVEEEPEKEEEKEEPKPELDEPIEPLDLSQLELALNPGLSAGDLTGDFTIQVPGLGGKGNGMDDLFSLADLDQPPRAVYRQQPRVTAAMRKRMPATVYLLFTVDENGRVEDPIVQDSDDAIFNGAALAAVRNWKFEPGKRGGQPVRSRTRQPMTFK